MPTRPPRPIAPLRLCGELRRARFRGRPNRFTLVCEMGGREVRAFLPNPGRLRELLLPGAEVLLEPASGRGRLGWTACGVRSPLHGGRPLLLHTWRANQAAAWLLARRLVPGLESARIARREVASRGSRFDFLLRERGREVLLEVKSCTLAGERVAMFPDAVTERGREHLEKLAGRGGAVLFLVHAGWVEAFLPDFHSDPAFAETLLRTRRRLRLYPVAVNCTPELELLPEARLLPIPWEVLEREAGDRGSYLAVLRLPGERVIPVGALGPLSFPAAHYIYVGSARRGLAARLSRHRRRRKRVHWHVDVLRREAEVVELLPIRASEDLECRLAASLELLADFAVPRFGCSDCGCRSHLFGFSSDPSARPEFQRMLLHYRIDRLLFPSPSSPACT